MGEFNIDWKTGDSLLDEGLSRHFGNSLTESPYGLFVFRRMSWLTGYPEARENVVYGHIGAQQGQYVGKTIDMLCGASMTLYAVSDIYALNDIVQLDDSQLCQGCSSKAEKLYWVKQ